MCEKIRAQLVEIETDAEDHYLREQAKQLNNAYWIALSDAIEEDVWVWMNSLSKTSIFNWAPNEPNNANTENCVALRQDGWNDNKCTNQIRYICEKTDQEEVVG
ncbi:hypothetical protein ACF0H5_017324 [Mactra antiquata]